MGWQKNSLICPFSMSDYNHFFIEISEKNHLFLCPGVSLPAGCEAHSKLDSNQAGSLIPVSLPPCPHAPQTAPLSAFTAELGCFAMSWLLPDVGQLWGLQPRLAFFRFLSESHLKLENSQGSVPGMTFRPNGMISSYSNAHLDRSFWKRPHT